MCVVARVWVIVQLVLLALLVIYLTVACGSKKPDVSSHGTTTSIEDLERETAYYHQFIRSELDEYGFVSKHSHCDSLLFTSLYQASGGAVTIERAINPRTGLFERHPAFDCTESTISKDMYIGLLVDLWQTKNLGAVKEIIKQGEKRGWVMGEGPAGKVVMTPMLMATLYEVRYRLGGGDSLQRHLYSDTFEGQNLSGFEAHLQVQHILLRGSLVGGLSDAQLKLLKFHAERQPRNGLFQAAYHKYTDGDQTEALRRWFEFCPTGHLPTTAERCDHYLWQRDDKPSDWAACPRAPEPEETYPGVDCLVLSALIRGVLY